MHFCANLTPPGDYVTGRIALIPQGGAKTRVIAIGDYWSQNILLPIHELLMDCLKRLETDGTYAQDDAFERIQRLAKGKRVWSIDLTRATDRFPVFYQRLLLTFLLGADPAKAWADIMTSRDFLAPDGTKVRWGAGQPLGLLSSWAAFSLTNHVIIEWIASELGLTRFRDYAVLGDDVAIWHDEVATRYMEFLKENGVSVSESKTIISTCYSQFEFAKRISKNGVEYTGLTYNLMNSHRLYEYYEFYRMCNARGLLAQGIVYFPGQLSENRLALLKAAIWMIHPEILAPNLMGLPSHSVGHFRNAMEHLVRRMRVELLEQKQEAVNAIEYSKEYVIDMFKARGIEADEALFGSDDDEDENVHPVVTKINQDSMALWLALGQMDGLSLDPSFQLPIQYLPCTCPSVYFGDQHKLKAKYMTTLCMKAWSTLTTVSNRNRK